MSNLPVGDPNTFLGEIEDMDLSELHGQMFGVAVGLGPRDGIKFACGSLLAPLDFYEMVELVAACYQSNQQHAKAFILNKDINKRTKYLDECTIDFIEARAMDIIADGLLSGDLTEGTPYTCRAGFFEEPSDEEAITEATV
jgi:hypothetical protein